MTRLKVGVVGAGRWGRNLIRCFSQLPEVHLSTICDLTRPPQAVLGEAAFVTSFEVLLDSDVEALVIATPAELHAAQAVAALESGRHVFVEKPMALSLREATRMRDAATAADRVLMVGHLLRYHPAILQLKRWIQAGHLGRIERMVTLRLGPGTADTASSPWWSLAPHDLSLAGYLLGTDLVDIAARPGAVGAAPLVIGRARTQSTMVDIAVSAAHDTKVRRLVVVGSERAARFDDGPGAPSLSLHEGRLPPSDGFLDLARAGWPSGGVTGEPSWEPVSFPPLEPLAAEVLHFVSAVRGDGKVATDADEGCRVIAALEAGALSLSQGGTWSKIAGRVSAADEAIADGRRAWHTEPELC